MTHNKFTDMTHLQNTAFKTKAGIVPDVSKILPEPGAFTISEHDGNLYYADDFGWHQAEQPYSPVTLFVDFNGVDQFTFTFKAPLGSTLQLYDGDGTVTDAPGADNTNVIHETNYAAAGIYYFTVAGEVNDITMINVSGQAFIRGSVNGWSILASITNMTIFATGMYGDLSAFKDLTELTAIIFDYTNVTGDVAILKDLVNITFLFARGTRVHGDFSELHTMESAVQITLSEAMITFDSVKTFNAPSLSSLLLQDNNFTSRMVDNALQSFVNLTGCTINLGGNNAKRTSASDAAFAIVDAANTLTVNS